MRFKDAYMTAGPWLATGIVEEQYGVFSLTARAFERLDGANTIAWSLFQKPLGHVFNVPEYQVQVPGRAIKWHVENVPHRLLEQTLREKAKGRSDQWPT
jgi:hypothetical protein